MLLLEWKISYILAFSNPSPSFLFFQNVCFITPQFLYQFFCLFSQQVSGYYSFFPFTFKDFHGFVCGFSFLCLSLISLNSP